MKAIQNEYNPQTVSHPGLGLREKLEELQMSPKEFAVRCNKPVKTISEVLNGKSAITPDMAIQFEAVLQIPAKFWLNRQYNFDESVARNNHKKTIQKASNWAKLFPYADLAKKGWVPPTKKASEKAEYLLKYFGISSHIAWENFYIKSVLKASFRISLAHLNTPHALSAWLRRGDIQARNIAAPDFSAKKLKAVLPQLKKVMAKHPADFFQQAQALCLEAGVKVVYTPCVPKAPINGVARWIDNNTTPLIQLSCRHKRNDVFWFSFFHELGHILLHGKKGVFLENIEYADKDAEKEKEADAFAIEWTFTEEQEAEVVLHKKLSRGNLIKYALQFGTHPGVIVGRLQRKKLIPYSVGGDLVERVELD